MQPSSEDLHPRTGARFVFEREGEALAYRVSIYMPEQRSWTGTLRWVDGAAALEPAADKARVDEPDDELAWAQAEALKLARVLHREPRAHMLRWRGR